MSTARPRRKELSLQLDLWREACRHIDVGEAVLRMAPLIGSELPADALFVRRLDVTRARLETVAAGPCHPDGEVPESTRTDLTPAQLESLVMWCRKGGVRRGTADGKDVLLAAVAPPGRGSVLVGPLVSDEGPAGFAVLWARGTRTLGPAHEELATDVLPPLAVALDNDRHVHELERLREAALADNRALLSRLQRQEIADSVVGDDSGLRDVMERVEQVAPTDAPVLILGETGSGKEVVARAIHTRSKRADGPIVRVNCGAIPSELVDSELFGHERGSFTGALATRKGWFERADGGTLFLDEVAELPLAAQVRLLRILQDGSFERVGGQRPISVDVRIVAATHRDPTTMIDAGTFREDLWYRISVFPIRLPPLRERIEDIPALAAHFAARAGKRLGSVPLAPSREDIDLLVSYPWPGNVRELAAVIERAAILGDGRRLEVAAALGSQLGRATRSTPLPPAREDPSAIETLDAAMARHIERALAATGGQIEGAGGAAARLGINPHTLRARMRKLRVNWTRFRR